MATRKELIKMLLNNKDDTRDYDELMEILIDEKVAIDTDKEENKNITKSEIIADKITNIAGSWKFIISFIIFLIFWFCLNLFFIKDLDPYPFILLNLLLSTLAALQAPIIMMSQNRQAKKDSLRSRTDYRIDLKSELILEQLHDRQEEIIKNQRKILNYIENDMKKDKPNQE